MIFLKIHWLNHFGFRLREASEITDILNKVTQAGGTVMEQGEFLPGSPYIFFKDPDGYTVEVWYEALVK